MVGALPSCNRLRSAAVQRLRPRGAKIKRPCIHLTNYNTIRVDTIRTLYWSHLSTSMLYLPCIQILGTTVQPHRTAPLYEEKRYVQALPEEGLPVAHR